MPVADEIELVRYLRAVARARQDPVLDVEANEQVLWLADLPPQVPVRTGADRGEVIFSIPASPLSPPAVAEEFAGWLDQRRWHRALRRLAERQGADDELVLATGLLTWTSDDGVPFRNHLLTTPARVVIDPATDQADVMLLDRPAGLQDRALLEGLAGFRPERAGEVRDTVRTGQGYALQESAVDVLRRWCASAFDRPARFTGDWNGRAAEPDTAVDQAGSVPAGEEDAGAPSMRLAPALVLRVPGRAALLDFYDDVSARLEDAREKQGPGATLSRGLDRLFDEDSGARRPGERLVHLPERSPQILADLMTALLARGRKVLVATQGPQAPTLAALHAALPARISPLCVGPAQVEDGVAMLAKRYSGYDPESHEQSVADLMSRLSTVQGIIDDLQERIDDVRSGEVHDLAPGYRGGLAELAGRVKEREPDCSWMPLDDHLPPEPPLTADEAAELLRLLAARNPQRILRTGQSPPAPATLPGTEQPSPEQPGAELPGAEQVLAEAPREQADHEQADQARCKELLKRLRSVHPSLAALMTARSGDAIWKRRLELWDEAWHWAYASAFVARKPRSDMEQRLERALAEARRNKERHARTLTTELAWGWCLSRMASESAYAALPARVMPIWQIVESIPPVPDSFDVVVLDETAQENVEALFLLWLAPRVIVVGAGEPRPARPIDVGPAPDPLGDVVTPDATLFSVLAARLGPVAEARGEFGSVFADEPAGTAPPPAVDLPLRPGRSIASYTRSELTELMSRLAATEDAFSDDQLIEHARTLLGTPAGEGLLATARLRYTLDVMQARAGEPAARSRG